MPMLKDSSNQEAEEPIYYCEVVFAIPLRQNFTYLYTPRPLAAGPQKETKRKPKVGPKVGSTVAEDAEGTKKSKARKGQQGAEEGPPPPLAKVYPKVGQRIRAHLGGGSGKTNKALREGWILSAGQEVPPALQAAMDAGQVQPSGLKALEIIDPQPIFGPKELQLARWMSEFYLCSLGEALAAILPTGKKEKEPLLSGAEAAHSLLAPPQQLSLEQSAAIQHITAALTEPAQAPYFYLFGPTGSGKTEVFLQVIQEILALGQGIIYLVPEISLSYQLQEQLEQRFGQRVALLHSQLSPQQRLWYWRALQQGEVQIVLGARSAIFAPLPRLGLIILDEEHETSYKAGSTPRYHARQVAMHRARQEGALLLMGSATPSVEAFAASSPALTGTPSQRGGQGSSQGGIQMLRLSKRLAGGSFPQVEIVDLRRSKTVISDELIRAIEDCTRAGGQAILFLNRRGYAPIIECFACGRTQECPHCSVALSYHKQQNRMRCHQCGFSMPQVRACLYCHQAQLQLIGFGTEQIEEELMRSFGHLRIARLDTDVARKKGESRKIIGSFAKGELDLLIGTQMIAKGLNFARVNLVGVILADTSLNMPDFRAAERCFSLLVQVAGRAGRFEHGGRVLIQTYQADNPVIQQAAQLDWEGFYRRELELRRMLHYPPFSRLVRMVFRGSQQKQVAAEAQNWAVFIRKQFAAQEEGEGGKEEASQSEQSSQVLGPSECPYAKVAGHYRYHILIRSATMRTLHQALQRHYDQKRTHGVYVELDIDPITMM